MKISKNVKKQTAIKSSEITPNTTVIGNPSEVLPVDNIPVEPCPYTLAQDFIKNAIGALTSVAGNDSVAKESIANLAVFCLIFKVVKPLRRK